MTSPRIVLRSGCVRSNGLRPRVAAFCVLAAAVVVAGCGSKSKVPVGDAAKNIRMLALGYVQFAASNGGVGPPNQEALMKFLTQHSGVSKRIAEKYFVSPRDNEPYEVFWGRRPLGASNGPDPPKPSIIIVERTGAHGTRFVADGQVGVKEMSADELAQAMPTTTGGK